MKPARKIAAVAPPPAATQCVKEGQYNTPEQFWAHGRITRQRLKLRLMDGRITIPCCFCGWEMSYRNATLEHVIPQSKGGQTELANLNLSCLACNLDRGTEDFDSYRQRMQSRKRAP